MDDKLATLRERIRAIEGRPAVEAGWVDSGDTALDLATGGLPRPGILELLGVPGSGRTRLALSLVRASTGQGHPVAWVDATATLFPPTAMAMGVDPDRLWILRPPPEPASWAVEQCLRSGCFPLVIADGLPDVPGAAARWSRAAHTGCSTLLVLGERALRELQVGLRMLVVRDRVSIQRHRSGRVGGGFGATAWPEGMAPWD